MRKTLTALFAVLILSGILFSGCVGNGNGPEPVSTLVCNRVFDDRFDDLDSWTLFGSPLPVHMDSVYGENGIFDNNGDPSYNSGAYSNSTYDLSNGFVIESEVYLDFSNPGGCWANASVGISDTVETTGSQYGNLISFGLGAHGEACWATPDSLRGHSYLSANYYTGETIADSTRVLLGSTDGEHEVYVADEYEGQWVILKIDVDTTLVPSFYINDELVFEGTEPLGSYVDSAEWPLLIGHRSSGSAGKAYHNSISLCLYELIWG